MTAVLPHAFSAIVRNDGVAEQTMRAWMQAITELAGSGGTVSELSGSFTLDDGTATASGVFEFDEGGA